MKIVGLEKMNKTEYPLKPFNPNVIFPEFKDFNLFNIEIDNNNEVYNAIRNLLKDLELDKENFDTEKWNPFKSLIKEGQNIVIKPNLVLGKHRLGDEGVISMITNASIIRPIVDYILLATNGKVNVTICDVPLQKAVWEDVINISGLKDLVSFYKEKGININLIDLRYEISLVNEENIITKRIREIRDPLGYVIVNLKKKSYFEEIKKTSKKLAITDYYFNKVGKHHNKDKNEYLISKTVLNADLFINIPKLKTHRKAGVTLSMKNLIGMNGDKTWIAHHRRGIDEYSDFKLFSYIKWYFFKILQIISPQIATIVLKLRKKIKKKNLLKDNESSKTIMEGNWYGNNTLWRSILDLNNIIFFADKDGIMHKNKQRKYLTIIDGVIGMDGEGPMNGDPKKAGIIIGGFHPVSVDLVSSRVMGFDYKKIPMINNGLREEFFNLSNFKEKDIIINGNININNINLGFNPSPGWKNNIEI